MIVRKELIAFSVCLGAILPFATPLRATTYYISPTGSDVNAGTALSAPWKTFAYAIPKLTAGDSFILLDGTYTKANSGVFSANGLTNAHTATASARITIKAQNERKAFLNGDGTYTPFAMRNLAYWTVEGLHIKSANAQTASPTGAVMSIQDCDNLIIRRMLLHHNNAYYNTHLLGLVHVNHSLIEENELYYFHRHGISAFHSTGSITTGNIFRRNYGNSRGYSDVAGGFASGTSGRGDMLVTLYPGEKSIVENNISEGNMALADIQSKTTSIDNLFLGNVSLNDIYGLVIKQRSEDYRANPMNNTARDLAVINPVSVGLYARGTENTRCEDCSFFNSANSKGLIADQENDNENSGANSAFAVNALVIGGTYGFHFSNQHAWGADYTNVTGATTPYFPDDFHITNKNTANPSLGTCKVWIPDSSPMKKAGKDLDGDGIREDIGANILYRYENGVLTNEHLWNPQTGAFPCGAIIAGVNDIPDSSCFDVHKRLNVDCNGCSFPPGYSDATDASSSIRSAGQYSTQDIAITLNSAMRLVRVRVQGIKSGERAYAGIYNLKGELVNDLIAISADDKSFVFKTGLHASGFYLLLVRQGRNAVTVPLAVWERAYAP